MTIEGKYCKQSVSFTNLPSLWKGFKWKEEKQVVNTILSSVGWERRKKREKGNVSDNSFCQSIFKYLHFVSERNFCQTIQFLWNDLNHTSLFPPVGWITFCLSICHSSTTSKTRGTRSLSSPFRAANREVRLSVSCWVRAFRGALLFPSAVLLDSGSTLC